MSASEKVPELVTADKLPVAGAPLARRRYEEGPVAVEHGSSLVAPEIDIETAKRLWNSYLDFRDTILSDPACYDDIDGHREMNRTGATRLALPFGLSIEEISTEEGQVQDGESGSYDYRFKIRVRVSKGARHVDGIGSCRLSEISDKAGDLSRREHFAMTKAWTRATKRAVSDILGGTEA